MDKKKIFKELVERLVQSAYYFGKHGGDEWERTLKNDKETLINFLNKEK